MALKYYQYVDINELSGEVNDAMMEYTQELEFGGQDSLLSFHLESLQDILEEPEEDMYNPNVKPHAKVIADFLKENGLTSLNVHLWW